ncbi:MAG: hypothetical protein HY079_13255 [Elusimicrobia bacterium]|nr:hypothetical protein [Elusimicrobiota bacterium]
MKNLVLAAAMMGAALGARAESFPATDPLSQMIIRQTVNQANAGVRGVVAVKGASAPIEISPLSPETKAAPAALAAKADPRDLALKTAPPLQAKKKAAKKGKAPKAAKEQLHHVAAPAKGWR